MKHENHGARPGLISWSITGVTLLIFRPPDLQKMYIRTLNLVTAEYRVAWGNR